MVVEILPDIDRSVEEDGPERKNIKSVVNAKPLCEGDCAYFNALPENLQYWNERVRDITQRSGNGSNILAFSIALDELVQEIRYTTGNIGVGSLVCAEHIRQEINEREVDRMISLKYSPPKT